MQARRELFRALSGILKPRKVAHVIDASPKGTLFSTLPRQSGGLGTAQLASVGAVAWNGVPFALKASLSVAAGATGVGLFLSSRDVARCFSAQGETRRLLDDAVAAARSLKGGTDACSSPEADACAADPPMGDSADGQEPVPEICSPPPTAHGEETAAAEGDSATGDAPASAAAAVVAQSPAESSDLSLAGDDGRKLLYQLAAQHWASLLLTAAFTFLSTLLKLAATRKMGKLYDTARVVASGAALPLGPLALLFGLRLLEGATKSLQAWIWGHAAAAIEAQLQGRLFRSTLGLDMATLDQCRTSDVLQRLTSDVQEVTRALEAVTYRGVRSVSSVAAGFISLLFLSKEISVLAVVTVPAATAFFVTLGKLAARAHRQAAAASEAAAAVAHERLAAIRTVRSFNQEAAEGDRYEARLADAEAKLGRYTLLHSVHLGCLSSLPGCGMALWLGCGSVLVQRGQLTTGSLTTVIPLAMEVANALGGLSRLHSALLRGVDAAGRLSAILSAARPIESSSGRTLPEGSIRGQLELRGVSFCYPSRPSVPAVDGISLIIRSGEKFAFVGPSGSGKTTLAALLERFFDPQEGSVLLDGVPLTELDVHWLRRQLGVVSQEPVLFRGTIRENIAYGRPEASDADVRSAAVSANADGFIQELPDGAGLSGGQRQRLAIARVLLSRPSVVLLDEATSALDSASEAAVTEALERVTAGRTTVVIAHRLSTVQRADRIGVVVRGRLVEVGTHEELMGRKGGVYAALVAQQGLVAR